MEELGEVYQDEENGAALLIRKHPKLDKLVVVSSSFILAKALMDNLWM